ncbi:MAG: MlaE family ABC transporter permease [Planctomycetota bacterium]
MSALRGAFERAGMTVRVLALCLGYFLRKPRLGTTLALMFEGGLKSLPVVSVVALFSGMIISLQTGIEMARFGQQELIGALVAQTFAREFGPFMTCIILVGTVVSAYAAEIGTMTVSEETAALEVLSIDPIGYLVAPRVLALTVMTFFLTVCADVIGIVGGAIVAAAQLDTPFDRFFDRALSTLSGRDWGFLPKDVYAGLFKAAFTGFVIAGVGCAQGLCAQGGALGVGRSVRRAVIASIVLILVISYDLTWLAYRAFRS